MGLSKYICRTWEARNSSIPSVSLQGHSVGFWCIGCSKHVMCPYMYIQEEGSQVYLSHERCHG